MGWWWWYTGQWSRLEMLTAELEVEVEKNQGIHTISNRENQSDLYSWLWKNRGTDMSRVFPSSLMRVSSGMVAPFITLGLHEEVQV